MSVVLSFELCEGSSCNTLEFKETTGAYSGTNPNGWTSVINYATSATLVITNPAGLPLPTIDLFSLSPSFPTINENEGYLIPMTSLGLPSTASMTDGVWSFLYTVTTDDGEEVVTYTQTVTQGFYCQVECCVNSMFKDIDVECDCNKDLLDKSLKAYLMLKGLEYSSNCGNISEFNAQLAILQKMCKNSNCSNCK